MFFFLNKVKIHQFFSRFETCGKNSSRFRARQCTTAEISARHFFFHVTGDIRRSKVTNHPGHSLALRADTGTFQWRATRNVCFTLFTHTDVHTRTFHSALSEQISLNETPPPSHPAESDSRSPLRQGNDDLSRPFTSLLAPKLILAPTAQPGRSLSAR